jgi:predicted nucleotidyltransferase
MQPELEQPLQEAVSFLEKSGYRYAVIGGIALSQWGAIRATRDVDIKVLVPEMNYQAVRWDIQQAFPTQVGVQMPENPFIVAVMIEGVVVDFLLTLPGYEENIIERAVKRDLGDFSVWICSAEDLIIQKAIAGREKDWPDVEALLIEQWGKLDQVYIEGWLSQFAEALEKPELLSKVHALQKNVTRLFE